MGYIGTEPVPKVSQVRTAGQLDSATDTIAVPGGFTPGNIEVFLNGYAVQPDDYDDSDGSNLVFTETLDAGTDFIVIEARAFNVSNTPTLEGGSQADFSNMPQVGGDPIVESGSNSDGEWTRWADGRQICTKHEFSSSSVGHTNGYAGGYRSTDGAAFIWNFPLDFIADPEVFWACSGDALPLIGLPGGISNSVYEGTSWRVSTGTADVLAKYACAIGRWK